MGSYWDRTDERRKRSHTESAALLDLQIELWGWCDMRQRDGFATWRNGWAGNLLNPPIDRRGKD